MWLKKFSLIGKQFFCKILKERVSSLSDYHTWASPELGDTGWFLAQSMGPLSRFYFGHEGESKVDECCLVDFLSNIMTTFNQCNGKCLKIGFHHYQRRTFKFGQCQQRWSGWILIRLDWISSMTSFTMMRSKMLSTFEHQWKASCERLDPNMINWS